MTENFSKITAEYGDADFNQRLNMYLQYPRLRSDFILIDQKDMQAELSAGCKSRPKLPLAQLGTVLGLMATCAKKIFGPASA